MNPAKLHDLAEALFDLFEQYGIEADQFALNIKVAPNYFEQIKDDFPESALDFVVSETGQGWTISIGRPMDWTKRGDTES